MKKRRRPLSGRVLLSVVVALVAAVSGGHALRDALGSPNTLASPDAPASPAAPGVVPAVVPASFSSGVVHSEVIGHSAQHRPIVAYELGDPHATYRAVVLGSMHGFYERAGETVTRALRTMKMPAGIHLWVIDTINPDGDALRQRGNAHGVDLNRNWPYLWAPISRLGCTFFVCHYSGPRALSEPESLALTTFLTRIKPNRVVSIHQPLNGVDTTDGGARDPAFRNALARNLNLPLQAFTCFGGCHGTLTSWLTHARKTTGITVEFPSAVAPSYLAGPATRGILSALMVGVRVPARPIVWRVLGPVGAAGPSAGGNTVTLTGSGFTTAWKVTFGGVPGTHLKVVSTHKILVVAPRHTVGLVTVRVTGVGGTSSATAKSRYTYVARPTVTQVTGTARAAGPATGRNTVTILGTAFSRITSVTFGGVRATTVRRLSGNRLTVVAPKHAAGLVTVRVTGAGGTSSTTTKARYTYLAPPTVRTVTGTAHATGPTAGANTVTITGTGFTAITRVTFGSTRATAVRRLSSTRLTAVAPKHAAGAVNVRVTGAGGTSSTTVKSRYTYLAPPTVRTVTGTAHATGPTAGANTVTITGTGFTAITRVTFGSTPASSVRTLSASRLTVVAPRRPAGTVNVQVAGAYGRSALVVAGRYTYVDRTAPVPVAHLAVSAAGPTSLTLSWTNPTDADFAGVMIRRAAGPTAPSSPALGTLVVDTAGRVSTVTDNALDPGTTYSYALFAHDKVPNLASPASVTATTATIDADAARPGS